jgi:hypothetical protein
MMKQSNLLPLTIATLALSTHQSSAGRVSLSNLADFFGNQRHDLAMDTHGDLLVAGSVRDQHGGARLRVVKLSSTNLKMLWRHGIRGSGMERSDFAWALASDGDGDVIVAGQIEDGVARSLQSSSCPDGTGPSSGARSWTAVHASRTTGESSNGAVQVVRLTAPTVCRCGAMMLFPVDPKRSRWIGPKTSSLPGSLPLGR